MSVVLSNKEEEKINELIREFYKKKAYFVIEEIIDYITNRVRGSPNITRNTIILILKSQIKNKSIIPGIKLVKENVLEIEKREEIFDFIKKNPGVNVNEIKKEKNLGSNHALWHIKCLEKFEFIRAVKFGNQKAFFVFELDSNHDDLIFYFRKNKVKQIILLLEIAETPLRPTAIADKLNTNYNTAKKYLDILVELNILSKVNGDEKRAYILNRENYESTLKELASLNSD